MSDENKKGLNPPPPVIVPGPSFPGGSSPADAAVAGLVAAMCFGVPQDVANGYGKYADREAHLGEEI